jgi:hypothetical protein
MLDIHLPSKLMAVIMKIGSFLVPPNTIKYTSLKKKEGRRGCDHMVVGVTTTCAISAYHYLSCEFEPRSGEVYSIQHYVVKFVSDLRQVGCFHQVLRFPPPIKLSTTI